VIAAAMKINVSSVERRRATRRGETGIVVDMLTPLTSAAWR